MSDTFRLDLLEGEQGAARRMVRSYSQVVTRVEREANRLIQQVATEVARGEEPGPALLFRRDRLSTLLTQAREHLRRYETTAAGEVSAGQQRAVSLSQKAAEAMTREALGPAPGEAVARVMGGWARLPDDALIGMVGRMSDGSPLKDTFARLGEGITAGIEEQLITGLAAGLHPRVVAAGVRRVFGTGLEKSILIARTEILTAYREGTRADYRANSDIVEGWIWHSALGPRTCPACWAMHGSEHSNEERLDGHPNCRCAMVPKTASWADLGFPTVKDNQPEIETGEALFAKLGDNEQRRILGAKGFAHYEDGGKLVDFLARRDDPRWGTMRYARSVKQIGLGGGGFQVGGAALPPPPIAKPTATAEAPVVPKVAPLAQQVRERLLAKYAEVEGTLARLEAEEISILEQRSALLKKSVALQDQMQLMTEQGATTAQHIVAEGQLNAIDDERQLLIERAKQIGVERFRIKEDLLNYGREQLRPENPISLEVAWGEGYKRTSDKKEIAELGVDAFERLVSADAVKRIPQVGIARKNGLKRAHYSLQRGFVEMSQDGSTRRVIVHELGHWLEHINGQDLTNKLVAWRDSRTAGEKLVRLRDLTGNRGFGVGEVTKPDKFRDAYIGKSYANGMGRHYATEVLSMGLEYMSEDPYAFAKADPDHFDLIFNVARGLEP